MKTTITLRRKKEEEGGEGKAANSVCSEEFSHPGSRKKAASGGDVGTRPAAARALPPPCPARLGATGTIGHGRAARPRRAPGGAR